MQSKVFPWMYLIFPTMIQGQIQYANDNLPLFEENLYTNLIDLPGQCQGRSRDLLEYMRTSLKCGERTCQ